MVSRRLIESKSSFRCEADNFYIEATVTAFESEQQINQRSWGKTINREEVYLEAKFGDDYLRYKSNVRCWL